MGSTYSLIALGLTLIFGIMKVINFAHGQMYMMGTFAAYYIYEIYGFNYFSSLLISIIVLAIIGVTFEKFFFKPVLKSVKREEVTMLLSIGLSLSLENFALISFGEKRRGIQPIIEGVFNVFNAYIPAQRLIIFLMAILSIIAFLLLMQYTRTGRALRALAQDKEVTYLMGVNVDKLSTIGFAVGAALAGLSGGILALIFPIFSGSGAAVSIKAFTMIMIGGAGVIPGAIIGGFILGMLESIGYGLIGGSLTYLFIYLGVIVFLVFRPNGIMGKPWG